MERNSQFTNLSKNVSSQRHRKPRVPGSDARLKSPEAPSLYSPSGDRKYLNEAERTRVLRAIETLPAGDALFALTLAWSGARISEVLALTRSRFQIERGLVAIRTLKRRCHSMREIPLSPELMQALDRHFVLSQQPVDGEIELPLWPWCRQTGWRRIKQVMRLAGISGRTASPRGLRHAFGVGTLQAGVPLNLVQRWLGHARISTTV